MKLGTKVFHIQFGYGIVLGVYPTFCRVGFYDDNCVKKIATEYLVLGEHDDDPPTDRRSLTPAVPPNRPKHIPAQNNPAQDAHLAFKERMQRAVEAWRKPTGKWVM